jgi:hypothetical protein
VVVLLLVAMLLLRAILQLVTVLLQAKPVE